jgi:hypothetical protein
MRAPAAEQSVLGQHNTDSRRLSATRRDASVREAEAAEERAREAHVQGARQGVLAEDLRLALSQNQQLASHLEDVSNQSIQVCGLAVLLLALEQPVQQLDSAFPALRVFPCMLRLQVPTLRTCLMCRATRRELFASMACTAEDSGASPHVLFGGTCLEAPVQT